MTEKVETNVQFPYETKKGMEKHLPLRLTGTVVKGFGRGSKELGIPTANLDESAVARIPDDFNAGIYYGWVRLHGVDYPMVMSIGWNPYYGNQTRSAEVHLLHTFDHDFYGAELDVTVLGFIRNEKNYVSKELLVADIRNDIEIARQRLASKSSAQMPEH